MKRLIAHGCSFTYGEELQNPQESSWPSLLAKHLGLSCTNLAVPGYSNDAMIHDLLQTDLTDSLVVMCWTSYLRMEHADYNGRFTTRPGQIFRSATDTNHREAFHAASWILDDAWLYNRWLNQVILLQSYFKVRGIAYVFFNGFDNQTQYPLYNARFQSLISQVDSYNFFGWPNDGFVEWADGTPRGPNGHPLEQGHIAVANKLLGHVNTIWN